ncbi:UDP-glucuronosyltransferase 1A4 [Aplysia californica]|uniref:UDP-glucuronosyltransferase n=1 Tax=Aplysia californica TaxID=6500 RepID=A0ABM0JP89_APLCA|nr:UDP-glucuronosyltransferase 1A4 [Aplysia californica]
MAGKQVLQSLGLKYYGSRFSIVILIFLQLLPASDLKRIVFLPVAQTSHTRSHANVARQMAAQGHDVWLGISEAMRRSEQVDTRDINIVSYGEYVKDLGNVIMVECGVYDNFWAGKDQDLKTVSRIGEAMSQNSIELVKDAAFISDIKRIQPHLIVLDWTPFCHSMLALPYKLNIPFAFYGSYHNPANARVPFTAACNPSPISELKDKLTFLERVQNFFVLFAIMTYNPFCDQDIISILVPEKPPIAVRDLSVLAEIFLVETDHILDYSRPMLPNTRLIGGTAARPGKPLTGSFLAHYKKVTNGFIVVSFGTAVDNIPSAISDKMLDAFERLDLGVVWKVNLSSAHLNNRVLTSRWIPQNDLLADVRTMAFVSHCGTNGLYEALYSGVPILCLPMFADQMHNAIKVENKGFGVKADLRHITAEELARLIWEVAKNDTYRNNIGTASKIFRKLYKEPLKEAAFWLEHVMEFGGSYMRFAGQEMPLYQFLLLDVLLFLFSISLILTCMLYCICRRLSSCLVRSLKNKTKQE